MDTGFKWLYLIILSLIWGSSFILIKKGLIGLTPMQLGAFRIIFASLLLFLVGFKQIKTIKLVDLKWIVLTGLTGTFFPAFLFAFAETEIDSSVASILNSLVPLNTIVIGFFLFKIKSTKRQVLGVFFGLIGALMLIINGTSVNPNQNYLYVSYIVIATIMYATSVNILKRYLQHVEALTITVGNFLVIFLPAVIVLISTGFFNVENLHQPAVKTSLFYVFLLALFGTAIAKVFFNKLVQMSSAVFASSVTYLMPIVAVFWGLLDGENFTLLQGISTIIILFGVYLAHKRA